MKRKKQIESSRGETVTSLLFVFAAFTAGFFSMNKDAVLNGEIWTVMLSYVPF